MPFRSGALQIPLQAILKQIKQGSSALDLYAVPLSIKYQYCGDMTRVIEQTLTRLEREAFLVRQPRPKGDRRAIIRIGEPINLNAYYEEFQQRRGETVDKLAEQLRQRVQQGLDSIQPLIPPGPQRLVRTGTRP